MMRYVFALLTIFLCQFTWADVAALTAFPTKRVEVNSGVGCRIAMTLPADSFVPGGVSVAFSRGVTVGDPLPKSWKANLNELYFSLSCKSSDDPETNDASVRLNPKTGVWEKDFRKWVREVLRPDLYGERPKEELKVLDKAIRVLNLKAANATGYASIEEATTGDEFGRERRMIFCLFHPPKAICGGGVVGVLRDGSKGDLTQHALKIIQSIEFLPDVKPLDATPASSSGGDAHQ